MKMAILAIAMASATVRSKILQSLNSQWLEFDFLPPMARVTSELDTSFDELKKGPRNQDLAMASACLVGDEGQAPAEEVRLPITSPRSDQTQLATSSIPCWATAWLNGPLGSWMSD
jgi:hypothetical protein